MSWRETRMPASACPHCGSRNDAASDPHGNATPKPGDLTICIGCTGVCVFTESLGMRKFTKADADAMPLAQQNRMNAQIARIQTALRLAKAAR